MSKPTLDNSHPIMRSILFIERVGLMLITLATIIAIGQELLAVFRQGRVELSDILSSISPVDVMLVPKSFEIPFSIL